MFTRGIIDAILDGSIDKAPTKVIPFFDFVVPTELPNVDPKILDPRDTYECACQWEEKAKDLAGRFIKNFAKFTGNYIVGAVENLSGDAVENRPNANITRSLQGQIPGSDRGDAGSGGKTP